MIIFHHNDADGITAGAVAVLGIKKALKEGFFKDDGYGIRSMKMDYPKEFPAYMINEGEAVFILDLSFTVNNIEEAFEAIFKKTHNVTWIDHHASSIDAKKLIKGKYNYQGIINSSYCAAYLAYFYFNSTSYEDDIENLLKKYEKKTPEFIKIVDLWDSWKDVNKNVRSFMARFKQLENDIAIEDNEWSVWLSNKIIKSFVDGELTTESNIVVNNMIQKGYPLVGFEDSQYKAIMENAFDRNICGVTFRCVNSYLGNSLLFGEDFFKYDAVLKFYYVPKDNMFTCSVYSNKDSNFNCGELAEAFGGGGHFHAAGFKLSIEHMITFLDSNSFLNAVWPVEGDNN